MSQALVASVNSACHPLPLWKRQIAVDDRCRSAHASSWLSGASARAVTTSAAAGGANSARATTILGCFFNPMRRAASPRKAALRASASIKVTSRLGRNAATTKPGNPAPLPRSTKLLAPDGTNGTSWAQSRICRFQASARVVGPTKLMALCHLAKSSSKASS